MDRHRSTFFSVLICAMLAVLNASHGLAGTAKCGPDGTPSHMTVPLSSFSIRTPIYVFKNNGQLLKGNLVTGKWHQISNHGFLWKPTIRPSANGRWISYSGVLKNQTTSQYWIFDKLTGSDRLYHQHPAWGGCIPEFSPDSKTILLFANYDTRWPSPVGVGLYLVDSQTMHSSFLGNPSSVAIPANRGYASVRWSKDGSEVLLGMSGFPAGGKKKVECFAYSIAEKRYDRISSEYDKQKFESKFFRGPGMELIPLHEEARIPSELRYRESVSPDGKWIASINRNHELMVSEKQGTIQKINVGRYDQCVGVTIGINGWLNTHLMVYTIDDETHVFNTHTGQKAVLFSAQDQPAAFFW